MLSFEELNEVCNDFLLHIYNSTGINDYAVMLNEYKNWYVGICEAPQHRHQQHLRKTKYLVEHFYFQNLKSLEEAIKIEKMLHNVGLSRYFAELDEKLELNNLDRKATFVYIFKFKE